MLKLSGFADEIAPALEEQIRVLKQTGITHFELRSIDKTNVLAFSDAKRKEYKKQIEDAGLGVISIGSPCGKKPVDAPDAELMDMFRKALDMAVFFSAPLIRVFSFYPPGGEGKGPIEPHRDRVLDLMRQQVEILDQSGTNVTMVHENEKGIYGDIGPRCEDLMKSIDSPRLRTAFDFANFVQCGDDPADNWTVLRPYTAHIHVKDAVKGSGKVVPAGDGDGSIGPILKDAYMNGYRGFLSLEPHLQVAAHSHGETGPELWKTAVDSLRRVCLANEVPLAS